MIIESEDAGSGDVVARAKFIVVEYRLDAQRYFAGMLGLLVIYVGLKLLFPSGHGVLAYGLRYLRFAALAFWAAYVAPRLFVRWGMA